MISLFDTVRAFLAVDLDTLREVLTATNRHELTFGIVVLAGISEALGQSLVLFANKVRPRRFLLSLMLSSAIFVIGYVFWVTSITFVVRIAFQQSGATQSVATAVGLSYVPLLFGFMALLPYFGGPIIKTLYLWTYVALVGTLSIALHLTQLDAIVCGLTGALLIQIMRGTVGRPLIAFETWLRNQTAGLPIQYDLNALMKTAQRVITSSQKEGDRDH